MNAGATWEQYIRVQSVTVPPGTEEPYHSQPRQALADSPRYFVETSVPTGLNLCTRSPQSVSAT